MENKEKEQQQASINVWGIANIGCTMENPTFQTLVVSPEEKKAQRTDAEEVPQEVKNGNRAGRPKKTGRKIEKAFLYHAYSEEETNRRLQFLYNGLLQLKWIAADTKQKIFLRLFAGEDTSCRVVWTGSINTLAELFRELISRKGYVTLPEGESIWVMVNARFWEKEGNKEFGNERLAATRTPIEDKDKIDFLVRVMNPQLVVDDIMKEMMQSQG